MSSQLAIWIALLLVGAGLIAVAAGYVKDGAHLITLGGIIAFLTFLTWRAA